LVRVSLDRGDERLMEREDGRIRKVEGNKEKMDHKREEAVLNSLETDVVSQNGVEEVVNGEEGILHSKQNEVNESSAEREMIDGEQNDELAKEAEVVENETKGGEEDILIIQAKINGLDSKLLVDTGADLSYIPINDVKRRILRVKRCSKTIKLPDGYCIKNQRTRQASPPSSKLTQDPFR